MFKILIGFEEAEIQVLVQTNIYNMLLKLTELPFIQIFHFILNIFFNSIILFNN